jgi:hypothetical protein
MKGTVTQWFWANPHCFLSYDVKDDSANVAHWVVETVTVEPVKNGKPVGRTGGAAKR